MYVYSHSSVCACMYVSIKYALVFICKGMYVCMYVCMHAYVYVLCINECSYWLYECWAFWVNLPLIVMKHR